jgi:hypothetical protein
MRKVSCVTSVDQCASGITCTKAVHCQQIGKPNNLVVGAIKTKSLNKIDNIG